MWHPPERIRHDPPEPGWPSPAEVRDSLLFRPVDVGPMTLGERTWVPAMVPWRATEDGFVTDDVLDWYERFARGQPGCLVVEATGVRDIPSGPLLRIGDDRFIPGLRELVETVRRASDGYTRLLIQIIDFLAIKRRPPPEKYFRRYLTITDRHREALRGVAETDEEIREHLLGLEDEELDEILTDRELESLRYGLRERVTDVHLDHVRELPEVLPGIFAEAARRAEEAGFDGVELHYAHAYTMASFLSARNTRADGYGGPRENRVRLPLEVYEACRETVGDRIGLGCRMLSDEIIEGGSRVDDACYFAERFARAGMDWISVSRGGKFEDAKQPEVGWAVYPYTGPSGYECMPSFISDEDGPFGRNVEPTARIRARIREAGHETPVVVAGGIASYEQAESILRAGKADIAAAARQTLADPDWWLKMRLGRGEEIRRCDYTNYCEALDQKHKQVTCKLWDRQGLDDPDLKRAKDGRRRLVAPDWEDRPDDVAAADPRKRGEAVDLGGGGA